MQIPIYHVDAFTDKFFCGNPAAVCILPHWLPDNKLHAIAKENNLPVTAFLFREGDKFNIRWITPEYELDICGHGSLSAGYVIFNHLEPTWQKADLQSRIESLQVLRADDLITLNFPAKSIESISLPLLEQGLELAPKETYQHKNERCLVVYDTEEEVKQLKPNMQILKKLEHRGITATATGKDVDFVSRTFYPQKTISEDPATGASHCLLAPYWAKRLNKTDLHALQVSERGGEIFCQYQGDRVLISGQAVMYMQGFIIVEYEIYKNDCIELTDYDVHWPEMARAEMQKLYDVLPKNYLVDIQHVGSTAIPGMQAKPIIDIQVAVKSLEVIKPIAIKQLKKLGYEHWYENPDPERMFFVKGMPPFGEKRTHHVHIVEPTSKHWSGKINFRDYLIAHPEIAKEYQALKVKLAQQYTYDREEYTNAKGEFVNRILQLAKKQNG